MFLRGKPFTCMEAVIIFDLEKVESTHKNTSKENENGATEKHEKVDYNKNLYVELCRFVS